MTLATAFFSFFLLYTIELVLPYIDMNLPRVYTCSPSWTPLPPPSPSHPSGSSQCTSPEAPCIMHRTWTGDLFHIWYYTCFNAILFKSRAELNKKQRLSKGQRRRGFQPGEPVPHQASSPVLADANTLQPQGLLATEGTRPWAHVWSDPLRHSSPTHRSWGLWRVILSVKG